MKAIAVINYLQQMVREHGDVSVEIETDHEIVPARTIRYEETDAARGDTIVIQGSFPESVTWRHNAPNHRVEEG